MYSFTHPLPAGMVREQQKGKETMPTLGLFIEKYAF